MRRALKAVVSALLVTLVATAAEAIVRRDDVPDITYRNLANQPQFASIGAVSVSGGFFCTAALIAPEWALCASHCLDGTKDALTFTIGTTTVNASFDVVHPEWTGNLLQGADVALIRLATAITGVTPAELYTGPASGLIGLTGTAVGFGTTGTGLTGGVTFDRVKRAGTNVIDATGDQLGVAPDILLADFDNPAGTENTLNLPSLGISSSSTPLPLEMSTAPGDSGGPLFVQMGGGWQIAGVASFGLALSPPFGDGNANADYGDIMGWALVSAPRNLSFISQVTGINFGGAVAPEPGTFALAFVGLVPLGMAAMRRRR